MVSLQEQMLKAGLVNKDKAKRVKKNKQKLAKSERKTKDKQVDEIRLAAEQEKAKRVERDRELNLKKEQELQKKAVDSQIKQLIEMNQVDRAAGEISYGFIHDKKVKTIHVTDAQQTQLGLGNLAIVMVPGREGAYEAVPTGVARKISQRNDSFVVQINEKTEDQKDEDDPYAEFEVPDDLMW